MSTKREAIGAKGTDGGSEIVLATEQRVVLEGLVVGKSVTEMSQTAGVGRTTIYRWLKDDPAFRAAYNQWHDQMQENTKSRLLVLLDKAADAIEKALEAGDAKAALELLRGMGALKQYAIGPTDAEELKRRADLERRQKNVEAMREVDKVLMDEVGAEIGM